MHRTVKPKTVFCRVSDEDYRRLIELSDSGGVSVSDLLRMALHNILNSDPQTADPVAACLVTVADEVRTLSREVGAVRADLNALTRQISVFAAKATRGAT